MVSNRIRQAILLATSSAQALLAVGGVPLLRRTLITLRRAGIERFVIVTGPESKPLRKLVNGDEKLAGAEIVWVENSERPDEDGLSVLLAQPHVRGDFLVVSVDRVFDPAILGRLQEEPLDGVTLAVGRNASGAKLSSPLRVQLHKRTRVLAVGEDLARFDAIHTGLASADRLLFAALEETRSTGDRVMLVDAFRRLASNGCARFADVGAAFWQDIETRAGQARARSLLLGSLRKSVDGPIARHINRRFSLALTRVLMNLPITPHYVTVVTALVSIAAAVTAAMATPSAAWLLGLGAVLWQVASMLDGTDGELARLKFQESHAGEWADTLTDDIGRFAFFTGFGYGMAQVTGEPLWFHASVISVAMQAFVAITLYRKLLVIGRGCHFALAWMSDRTVQETWLLRAYRRIEFMSRRDYYIFVFMCAALLGVAWFGLIINYATTTVVFIHETVRPRQLPEARPTPRLTEIRDRPVAGS